MFVESKVVVEGEKVGNGSYVIANLQTHESQPSDEGRTVDL